MQLKNALNILMVEDNLGDQYLLSELLASSELEIQSITTADTVEQAIKKIGEIKTDVILLDLSLPDASGIESFNAIKPFADKIPVIILSGMRDTKLAVEAITEGAQDYLIKGEFDEKMLTKTIVYAQERMNNFLALRESNDRYNLVSMATNDMVWDWDLKTGEVYRNKEGWKKIFEEGLDNEHGTTMNWEEKIHPDDLKKLHTIKQEITQKTKKDVFEFECRILKANGTIGHICDRGFVLRNDAGEPIRLIGATQDITERKRSEILLKEEQIRKHKEITDAAIVAQENEKQKIGAELHDNVNQILASCLLYLNLTYTEKENAETYYNQTHSMINMAIDEIRKLSHSLIPPSLNGDTLVCALNNLVDRIEETNSVNIERNFNKFEESFISEKLKLTLYRIVQEQFNNIFKYAKASKINLNLIQDEKQVHLSIEDDGIGFDVNKKSKGVGLTNIKTRATLHNGQVEIISQPGSGCKLLVTIPADKMPVITTIKELLHVY